MTACCDICQHPACWKAEIDIRRGALRNEYGYFNNYEYETNSSLRYDARSECIVKIDGSLPTYKTLDLLASGFPSGGDSTEAYEENASGFRLPQLSFEQTEQSQSSKGKDNQSFPSIAPINKTLSNYIQKICNRHKEVERQEHESRKDLSEKIIFKTLKFEDVQSFGDEYTKVYTWVPGKNSKSKSAEARESKEKVLALKMIDGADLPNDCSLSDENKHHHKIRSEQRGYRRGTVPYHVPPLGTEDHDDYIQLLRYIDLTRINCTKISMNNQNVRIPSALQTARVKLYESSDDNRYQKPVPKSRHTTTQCHTNQDIQMHPAGKDMNDVMKAHSKTMYIRNGVVLSKSPVFKKSQTRKSRKRTPLPLTRVSVPKKAVRNLPLFDHCSSSIKKTDLPDVTMQPITSSENTSVISSDKSSMNPSLAGDLDLLHYHVFSSPDLVRAPVSSPLSAVIDFSPPPTIHLEKKENAPECDIESKDITESFKNLLPDVNGLKKLDAQLERSEKEMSNSAPSGRHYLHFDGENKLHHEKSIHGARIAPSAIMISKASKSDTQIYRKEIAAQCRQSPTMSLGSKGSLDGWLLDKDIISRTYDKYQSFSPFKTPHCSAHVFRDDVSEKSKRNNDNRMPSSRRQILPPSLHNLDQFLPGDEESLRTNTSFTTRCLSPSRSMFIRQQKQPPIENVPSEIMVSRFPLLPAITKSQRSVHGDLFSNKQNETDIIFLDTPRYTEEVTLCSIDDDYEEDVEEVLLNKEAFSTFDFYRLNNNLQPVNNDPLTMNNDPLTMNNDPLTMNNDPQAMNNLQPVNNDPQAMNNLQPVNNDPLTMNNDLQAMNNDPQAMNNDPQAVYNFPPSQNNNPKSTIKNEKVMNSLNVYNREINNESNVLIPPNQYGSNFLLQPNQKRSNFVTLSNHSEDDFIALNLPYVTSNTPDSNEAHSSTPERAANINGSKENLFTSDESSVVNGENIRLSDGNILVTPENISSSDKNIHLVTENKHISVEYPEISIPGKFADANQVDNIIVTQIEFEGSESNGDFLKVLTPVSSGDNLTPNSCIPADDQINNSSTGINSISPESTSYRSEVGTESTEITTERNQAGNISNEFSRETSTKQLNSTPQQVYNILNGAIDADSAVIENSGMVEINRVVKDTDIIESGVVIGNNVLVTDTEIIENIGVVKDTEIIAKTKIDNPDNSNISFNKKVSHVEAKTNELTPPGELQAYKSSTHLADEPVQSVMKHIFNNQLVENSSLYLTPRQADDFTEGLDFNLELEEEIVRAMDGLEEFVLDDYEVENN